MTQARASFGQMSARAFACDNMPFALPVARGNNVPAARWTTTRAVSFGKARLCDIFPLNWFSRFAVGPFFHFKDRKIKNALHSRSFALESALITTNYRGISCGNYLHLAFWSCPFRPVLKMTFSAGFWAWALVRRLPMPRADRLWQGLSWAALPARSATILTSAGRATNPSLTFGSNHLYRPSGQSARLADLLFAPRALARSWRDALCAKELAHV